jgi:NADP-dependent 3-hydroxy acid dehydrogenase YdfG
MLPAPISELRTEQWQQQIDLNVSGAMHIIEAFVQQLITVSETGRTTDLINISSIAAQYLYQNFAVYSATKAFISHFTRHLRLELGPKDIRVSMIEPGATSTELQGHFTDPGATAWFAGVQKTMELLRPEDVAEVIAFTTALPRHVNLQQVTVMPTRMGQ